MTSYGLKTRGYMQSFNHLASKLWLFIRFWDLKIKIGFQFDQENYEINFGQPQILDYVPTK